MAFSALIDSGFLRFAMRALFKFLPPPMMAFNAMLVSLTAAFVLGRVYGYYESVSRQALTLAERGLFVLANFPAIASVLVLMIDTPRLRRLGFWKGCVLALAVMVVAAVVVGVATVAVRWLL